MDILACPCGGMLKPKSWVVNSVRKTDEWASDVGAKPPIKIDAVRCKGCTRSGYRIIKDGVIIKRVNV